MSNYVLSCCSTADLSAEHFLKRDIHYISFHYRMNGQDFADIPGDKAALREFYQFMRDHEKASDKTAERITTSQVNISEYLTYFANFLEQGMDVFHVCLSSGLSGAWNSCINAANIAKERYPDREIIVIDSLCASTGYGLFMDALADQRDAGMGLHELQDWAEQNKLKVNHLFFSTDLSYYYAGGRISRSAALFGGILNICPLLHMDAEGRLVPIAKLRGKTMAMKRMLKKMEELADNGTTYSATSYSGTSYNGPVYICHSDCEADALTVKEMVETTFPNLPSPVKIYDVGTVIGAHTGPGTVALFFFGRSRNE